MPDARLQMVGYNHTDPIHKLRKELWHKQGGMGGLNEPVEVRQRRIFGTISRAFSGTIPPTRAVQYDS